MSESEREWVSAVCPEHLDCLCGRGVPPKQVSERYLGDAICMLMLRFANRLAQPGALLAIMPVRLLQVIDLSLTFINDCHHILQ